MNSVIFMALFLLAATRTTLSIAKFPTVISRVSRLKMSTSNSPYPISLIVSVEIKSDKVADFLKVIEEDAIGSRERENGGCLRFDVHRDQANDSKFIFYEVYKDESAILFHKNTEHFKLWTDFKASGGVVSQSVIKNDAIFFG